MANETADSEVNQMEEGGYQQTDLPDRIAERIDNSKIQAARFRGLARSAKISGYMASMVFAVSILQLITYIREDALFMLTYSCIGNVLSLSNIMLSIRLATSHDIQASAYEHHVRRLQGCPDTRIDTLFFVTNILDGTLVYICVVFCILSYEISMFLFMIIHLSEDIDKLATGNLLGITELFTLLVTLIYILYNACLYYWNYNRR